MKTFFIILFCIVYASCTNDIRNQSDKEKIKIFTNALLNSEHETINELFDTSVYIKTCGKENYISLLNFFSLNKNNLIIPLDSFKLIKDQYPFKRYQVKILKIDRKDNVTDTFNLSYDFSKIKFTKSIMSIGVEKINIKPIIINPSYF